MISNTERIPKFISESTTLLKAFHGGSRVTCNPAPTDTDDDYVVLIAGDLVQFRSNFDIMTEQGFTLGGSRALNNAGFNIFKSWKKGDLNIILTQNADWYEKMLLSTKVCAAINLAEKEKRIKVFEAIVYGMEPSSSTA